MSRFPDAMTIAIAAAEISAARDRLITIQALGQSAYSRRCEMMDRTVADLRAIADRLDSPARYEDAEETPTQKIARLRETIKHDIIRGLGK